MNVAIAVWNYKEQDTKFRTFLAKAIMYFSGFPYTHAGIVVNGTTYDMTRWTDVITGAKKSGVRVSWGYPEGDAPDYLVYPPDEDMTADRLTGLDRACIDSVKVGYKYNVLKLLVLAIVWPTRWFWKKIGWVPFNAEFMGEVCSVYVDEIFKTVHWDIFPKEHEGYTVPGQFMHIPNWTVERVKI